MEQALFQAAVLTFEELGFVFPEGGTDLPDIDAAKSFNATVGFQGDFSGDLLLSIEADALTVIASNMLGEDEPLNDEMRQDVLGEITNVICGNALPAIGGANTIYRLNAPQFHAKFDSQKIPSATARVALDEGRADISLYLN
jgi:CheY-specific phosphatase CheX